MTQPVSVGLDPVGAGWLRRRQRKIHQGDRLAVTAAGADGDDLAAVAEVDAGDGDLGLLETRSYMRARWGLAECSWALDERTQAVEHAHELLRLNPNDNQGIRHTLLAWLIDLDRDRNAAALLAEYEEDGYAGWLYTRALLAFRSGGASESACSALAAAIEVKPHVPPLLLRTRPMPASLPRYMTFGGETEAVTMVAAYADGWRRTPGALSPPLDQHRLVAQ